MILIFNTLMTLIPLVAMGRHVLSSGMAVTGRGRIPTRRACVSCAGIKRLYCASQTRTSEVARLWNVCKVLAKSCPLVLSVAPRFREKGEAGICTAQTG